MRNKVSKGLRRLSRDMAAEWIKTLLPEADRDTVTPEAVKKFEEDQEKYVWVGGTRRISAYSSAHFYKRMKKAYIKGVRPNFLVTAAELG